MSQALRIFQKDVVQLWPPAACLAVLLAALAWGDAGIPEANSGLYPWFVPPFYSLGALYLAAWVIRIDGPAGECPYWLTRPVARRSLLLGKLLSLAAFLNLPLLLAQACVLAANGIFPLDHLSILVWRQIFFTARLVLPAAALAAVCDSLAWFSAGALLYFVLFYLPGGLWLGWDWIRVSFLALVALAASEWVLAAQILRRETARSRLILASAAGVLLLVQFLPWHAGFAL